MQGLGFSDALLEGMLGLLLFAGALHVKLSDLRAQWRVVFLMATMGVALSTLVVGVGFSWLTGMPLLIALVFGALISPTDPVAVLGVLREANLRKSLETKIAGRIAVQRWRRLRGVSGAGWPRLSAWRQPRRPASPTPRNCSFKRPLAAPRWVSSSAG